MKWGPEVQPHVKTVPSSITSKLRTEHPPRCTELTWWKKGWAIMDICPVGSVLMSYCPTGGQGGREVKGSWGTFPWPGISLSQSPPAPIYIQIEIQIDLFSFFEIRGFTFHCDELWFTIWYKTWFKKLKLTQISTFQVCVYRGDARQGDPRRWGHATGEEISRRSQPLTSCVIVGTIPHLSHYRRLHL